MGERFLHESISENNFQLDGGRWTFDHCWLSHSSQKRPHSRLPALQDFGSQILSMLTDDARQVIKCQSDEYTWSDLAGLDEEMDDMTFVALALRHLCPHHKVDMYAEIGNVQRLSLHHMTMRFIYIAIQSTSRNWQ